jgi:hypothetical protein
MGRSVGKDRFEGKEMGKGERMWDDMKWRYLESGSGRD